MDFENSSLLTVWAVKRPILHNRAKFREDLPIRCCDIAIFVVFQDGGGRHLGFSKTGNFNGRSAVRGNMRLKMAAVRHLGFVKFKFINDRSG